MTDSSQCRCEYQRCADATKYAKHQHEVPVCSAKSKKKHAEAEADTASQDQKTGPMGVEDRSYLNTTEEGQKNVHAEDPAYCAFAIVSKLVFSNVSLDWPIVSSSLSINM